ncbi:hypothetical protein [Thermotoga profunda]|uniref:hypothetical protein n=1 Tax=Thermotoga profunda TaxID=1508420 RepID=UPI000596B246|nr:hypothetical protein [Thermotoga profunda]
MKKVKDLTDDELAWLHDQNLAKFFNDRAAIDKYRVPDWKITLDSFESFTADRYKIIVRVEKIEIIYEKRLVIFEGSISIKDNLLKRKLIVRCFGFVNPNSRSYEIIADHTPDELSQFMDIVKPGKNLKIKVVEETIKDILENFDQLQTKGGENMMNDFFKLLNMYAESIQNAGHSADLMFKILQERIKMIEQNESKEYANQLFENLYDLQYKGIDLVKQSENLLIQIMNMCSKLYNNNVKENQMTA